MRGRLEARLYLTPRLAAGAAVVLAPGQTHHLRTVLRLAPGAAVSAFNGRDGEWLCRIAELDRDRGSLAVEQRLRPVEPEADLWLVFAPIKRARLDWLVEKATELGVSALLPVWTRHTQAERLNLDRLRAHAVAAAEQSERLSVPELRAPHPLDALLIAFQGGQRGEVASASSAQISRGLFADGAGRWRAYRDQLAPVLPTLAKPSEEPPKS